MVWGLSRAKEEEDEDDGEDYYTRTIDEESLLKSLTFREPAKPSEAEFNITNTANPYRNNGAPRGGGGEYYNNNYEDDDMRSVSTSGTRSRLFNRRRQNPSQQMIEDDDDDNMSVYSSATSFLRRRQNYTNNQNNNKNNTKNVEEEDDDDDNISVYSSATKLFRRRNNAANSNESHMSNNNNNISHVIEEDAYEEEDDDDDDNVSVYSSATKLFRRTLNQKPKPQPPPPPPPVAAPSNPNQTFGQYANPPLSHIVEDEDDDNVSVYSSATKFLRRRQSMGNSNQNKYRDNDDDDDVSVYSMASRIPKMARKRRPPNPSNLPPTMEDDTRSVGGGGGGGGAGPKNNNNVPFKPFNLFVGGGGRQEDVNYNDGTPPMNNAPPPRPPMPQQSPLEILLDNLKASIFPKEARLRSLAEALLEFDHKNRYEHDAELRFGAANVLFQKLAFAFYTAPKISPAARNGIMDPSQPSSKTSKSTRFSDADHEIAMICTALEMVYRASDHAISRSYQEIGEEILPLIIEVINRPIRLSEEAAKAQNNNVTRQHLMNASSDPAATIITKDQKVAVQKITKVLAAFSLIPSAKYELAHAPNLISSLIKIIDTSGGDRMLSGNYAGQSSGANGIRNNSAGAGLLMTEATRFNAVAIITNIAHADGNKMFMIAQPGLVENISRVANSDPNDVSRRCASLAIMNLSNGDDNNIPNMTGKEYLFETLCALMKDDNPETRRNAAVSLYNLACSDDNADLLAKYEDGIIIEALVEIVTGVGKNTLLWNDKVRSSAAETIFNMTCSKNKATCALMANHPCLLEGLTNIIKNDHAALDVKMFTAATIRRLAEIIEHPMLCLGALLTALVKGKEWTKTDCIAQGFVIQAMNVEHRKLMVHHHGLLTALSTMAMVQGDENAKIRASAISAIGMLSTEYETRAVMAQHEGIMMALTRASYQIQSGSNGQDTEEYGEYFDPATMDLVKGALKNLIAVM